MEKINVQIILKPRREKPILNRHPWIFSGAIQRVVGSPSAGELVTVCDSAGTCLGVGYFNASSQIRVRLLTWGESAENPHWHNLLKKAISRRKHLGISAETTAYRLINAEADGLPGLIVDRYGDHLVMQCLTMGIDLRKEKIADLLEELLQPTSIIERSDAKVRRKEGLPLRRGTLRGTPPEGLVMIKENGVLFEVDLLGGHKTGFYLDQRDNRALIGSALFSAEKDVLNLFSYTGGFGVYAAKAGAKSVVNVDSSVEILESAERNFAHNGLQGEQYEFIAANVFEYLRHLHEIGAKFDTIILDPPKFVNSQRDLDKAARGYKDLSRLAFGLLRPHGTLATFSCSGLMPLDLFQKILFSAAVEAKTDATVLRVLSQAADHTMSLTFPESFYLKGFLCKALGQ